MHDTQSLTESLLDIIKGIEHKTIMLPEFQRDFRWELEQTYDLFDSLIRNIFIGTIIYGKPSFGMTLREIDQRPRRGKGSRIPLVTHDYSTEQIVQRGQTQNLRIVLDGQQRITSIYRALVGIDAIYLILRNDLDLANINDMELEDILYEIAGEESSTAISVKLSDAYNAEKQALDQDEVNEQFDRSLYARKNLSNADRDTRKLAAKAYRLALRKLINLYRAQKMVAYYLLDMNLEKFCIFFERSNSRGIQLNFTDILAAKLYRGFNLRKKIEEFETDQKISLNREIIVRAIAFICGIERLARDGKGAISIDKQTILKTLEAEDFNQHWDEVCKLYVECLHYLTSQHYILSKDWMPSENMLIPLMMFRRNVQSFGQMSQEQREFLEYWYWASIFSNRYSTSSNEVIITDSIVLTQVAQDKPITTRNYFARLRLVVTEPDDLLSYTKKSSMIYRGVLNLIGYAAQGLHDWNNTQKIDSSMRLEDHHIYPRAYITSRPVLDVDQVEAEQLMDCVVNRTLIPKLLNIKIGKKAPQLYLSELLQGKNPDLATCVSTHLIPDNIITEPAWNSDFRHFLDERAQAIYALIDRYAIEPAAEMVQQHKGTSETGELTRLHKARIKDMLIDGRVKVGDKIYVRKYPDRHAVIVNSDTVQYNGQQMPINTWGQNMTGWSSINIYEQVFLVRTGEPLKNLRDEETVEEQ
jgi:hypothetical protein